MFWWVYTVFSWDAAFGGDSAIPACKMTKQKLLMEFIKQLGSLNLILV